MAALPVSDTAHWHQLRGKHVGGSEVAALFDTSPWLTRFGLWHRKAGKVPIGDADDSRMRWGRRLEPAIAAGVAEDMRWKIEPSKVYHTHPSIDGMGCTLDFDIVDHEHGPGILEIKLVAEYATWMTDWSDDRAPAYYELQVQHQLACTGCQWAIIACFIGQTTSVKLYERRPAPKIIGEIERRVTEFWSSIRADQAPDPFGAPEELDIIKALHPVRDHKKIIEIHSEALGNAAQMYRWAKEQESGGKSEAERNRIILLNAAGDAGLMRVPGHDVSIKTARNGAVTVKVEPADNGIEPEPTTPTTLAA